MNKIKNIKKLSILAKSCVLILLLLYNFGCSLYKNEIIKEIPSPTGNYKAVIFQRDCGATTGFSTQISIIKINEKLPNKSGNIFIADTNHGEAPAAPWGGPRVKVTWKNNNKLVVHYNTKARIFKETTPIYRIDIEYIKDI